jgi:hypothetical protein
MAQPSAPERPLDHALALVANADPEGALRYALPLVENEPKDALSAFVAGRALAELGDAVLAGSALSLAARRAIGASAEQRRPSSPVMRLISSRSRIPSAGKSCSRTPRK